jgi:peptidoglycan/LPS O-acetylase OafA/YrhL
VTTPVRPLADAGPRPGASRDGTVAAAADVVGWSVRGRRLPALDGLRALAVLAVVAYHLQFSWARGGYLGVDLFFVLSGFLITSLLLEEHEERGAIRLGAFWARRARRLLPALFVMVSAVMVFVVLMGRLGNTTFIAGFDLASLQKQALATLLYVANWYDIVSNQSYFAQFAAPSPLLHTWSLAIEEQFYLVWPFVTVGLLARGLAARRRVGWTVSVAIAIASTVLMAVLYRAGDPSRAYFGTDTRLPDLAVGAVLAWLTARRPVTAPGVARVLAVASPIALAGLLVLMVVAGDAGGVPDTFMFRGGFLLAALLCVLVVADVRRDGSTLARGFAWRPVVAVGLVSYGIYLWHWPVIVFLTSADTPLHGAGLLLARLVVIAALTVASYYLVELPVRRRWLPVRVRWVVYPLATACTFAVVLVATPSFVVKSYVRATLERYAPSQPPRGAGGVLGVPIRLDHPITPRDPLRVLLLGDSQMIVNRPGIAAALGATGEATVAQGGFPAWGLSAASPASHGHWQGWVRDQVRASHADVVAFTTGWDGAAALDGAPYRRTLGRLVAVARAAGAAGVVFLEYPTTHPSNAPSPAALAAAARGVAAWNADAAAMPARLPGTAMYFPLAGSVERDGRYAPWVSPPRDPGAARATWDRVRRLDGVHLCPAGIELYAAALAADAADSWHLPAPSAGWWVDGWQRAPVVTQGDQYCPADHPPG